MKALLVVRVSNIISLRLTKHIREMGRLPSHDDCLRKKSSASVVLLVENLRFGSGILSQKGVLGKCA